MNQVIIINQTQNSLSYVNGQVTIAGSSSTNVNLGLVPYLILDPSFNKDVLSSTVLVSDSGNIYQTADALDYLKMWLSNGPPQNSNDPISFTLGGFGFCVTADASLPNTTETPLLLMSNPSNSGVNARAMYIYTAIDSTQGILTTRVYVNPTISNNGNALPPQNNLVSQSAPSSAVNLYAGPTASSKGTLRISIVSSALTSPPLHDFKQTAILTPGNSMLITGQAANLGLLASLSCHFYIQWVES